MFYFGWVALAATFACCLMLCRDWLVMFIYCLLVLIVLWLDWLFGLGVGFSVGWGLWFAIAWCCAVVLGLVAVLLGFV